MIGSLARKRTNLVALTALFALVAAMFVGLQSASAAPTLVLKASNDSDGIVEAGTTLSITAYVKDPAATDDYTLHAFESSSGLVIAATEAGVSDISETAASPTVVGTATVLSAATAGTYNVSVVVRTGAPADTSTKFFSESYTITVGETGAAIGSVTVALGKEEHSSATDAKDDTDQAPAYTVSDSPDQNDCTNGQDASCIAVTVTVKNGLGNDANDADVQTVYLFAPAGQVVRNATGENATASSASVTGTQATATTQFFVSSNTAQTIQVYALVVGATGKGNAESAKLPLSFSGSATKAVLGDVSGNLKDDDATTGVYFDVTATDDGGVKAALAANGVAAAVKANSWPTGGAADNLVVTECDPTQDNSGTAQCKDSGATEIPANTIRYAITENATTGAQAKAGDYMIEVTLGTDKQTATVTVVGAADSVELSADMTEATFGDIITLTATVKDKNGNPVANTTGNDDGVDFTWAESGLKAQSLDNSAGGLTSGNRNITKGEATAKFVVTSRTGDALVIASSSDKKATLALSAPMADEDPADMPEPVEPAEPTGTDCLSNVSGFSTWKCATGTTLGALYDLLPRASAVSVHNGASWDSYTGGGFGSAPANTPVTQYATLYITR